MSPKLKPLLLPQLVEERRKLELQLDNGSEQTSFYYTYSSSSSDIASPSPVTSTFSAAGPPKFRGCSSSSEFATSPCSESPESPTPQLHANKPNKSPLPDVQEDPLEREDEDLTALPDHSDREFGLYDCLCT